MVTHFTTVLQRYLFGILVTLRANLDGFTLLASKFYLRGEEMLVDNVTAGVATLLFCSGSGEASRSMV